MKTTIHIFPSPRYRPGPGGPRRRPGGNTEGPRQRPKASPDRVQRVEGMQRGIREEGRRGRFRLRDAFQQRQREQNDATKKEKKGLFSKLGNREKRTQLTRLHKDLGMTEKEFQKAFPDMGKISGGDMDKAYARVMDKYGPDLEAFAQRREAIQELIDDPDRATFVETLLDDDQRERLVTHGFHDVVSQMNDEDANALRHHLGDDFHKIQTKFVQEYYRADTSRELKDLPRFVMQDVVREEVDMMRLPGAIRIEALTFQADEKSLKRLTKKLQEGGEFGDEDMRHVRYLTEKYSDQESRNLLGLMDDNLGEALRVHFMPMAQDFGAMDNRIDELRELRDNAQNEEEWHRYNNAMQSAQGARDYARNYGGRTESHSGSNYPSPGSVNTRAYSGTIEGIPGNLTPREIDGPISGVRGTGYFPPGENGYANDAEARMEGGPKDRIGNALRTLQDYLDGDADYVSVAMDPNIPNGTVFTSKELNDYFAAQYPDRVPIKLMMCDTGSAFRRKGWSRIDICCADKAQSLQPYINRSHTLMPIDAADMAPDYSDHSMSQRERDNLGKHPELDGERQIDRGFSDWIVGNRVNNGKNSCGASVGDALLNYAQGDRDLLVALQRARPSEGRHGRNWDDMMNSLADQGLVHREPIRDPSEARAGAILAYNEGGGGSRSSAARQYGHVEIKSANGTYIHYLESSRWGGSAGESVQDSNFAGYAYYLTKAT